MKRIKDKGKRKKTVRRKAQSAKRKATSDGYALRSTRYADNVLRPTSHVPQSLYDGLQENVRGLVLPKIEVWENKYSDKKYVVRFDTDEFTCICPKTGLPDYAYIFIEYSPGKSCVELKSFKEYLMAYRDIGIFHEHVVNRILEDIVSSCKPRWAKVKGEFNTRGGITTVVEAEYKGK